MKGVEGVSVTSTKGKLEVLQKHYKHLGRVSVDSDFDDDWKEEVESKVEACGRMSGSCEDAFLDKWIEKAKCLRKLKNNKTGGSDGLVGELLKYGGSGMVSLLEQLFSVVGMRKLYLLTVRKICSVIEQLGFEATLPESSPNASTLPALPDNSHSVCIQQSCVMTIDGMTCSSCVGIIESHLREMEAVEAVQVLLKEKEGRVIYNAAVTNPQNLLTAVEDLGYTVTHVDGMFQ